MSIDVFGRHLGSGKVAKGPPGIFLNLTKTGDFDLEQKKLCNVADAVDEKDAINLNILKKELEFDSNQVYEEVNYQINRLENKIKSLEEEAKKSLDKIKSLEEENKKRLDKIKVLDIPEEF